MMAQPEHYLWSSYLAPLGQKKQPVFLTTEWLLGNFSDSLTDARQQYCQFVTEGMGKIDSPWDKLTGQMFLGSDAFVRRVKAHFGENAAMSEIPQQQHHAERTPLDVLFPLKRKTPKTERNRLIRRAHTEYGYMLKEIAQTLGLHYTTVSKIINDERR